MTYTPGSVSADAVLDNVLKSLTGTVIVLSTRPVHLVHFREEMARHLTTNQIKILLTVLQQFLRFALGEFGFSSR